jgi:hypothetical protein
MSIAVGALALAAAGTGRTSSPHQPLAGDARVTLQPAVVSLGRTVAVAVAGLAVPSLEARAAGASANFGQALPWRALRLRRGVWHGVLPAPELRGVYPLELRVRRGAPVLRSADWLVRVYAPGTLARPAFATPEDVARWWVSTLPSPASVVALRRWPCPPFDLRDPRLHQLLVVAYSALDRPAPEDRLGMFVTAVRDGFGAPWRLLEATLAPS